MFGKILSRTRIPGNPNSPRTYFLMSAGSPVTPDTSMKVSAYYSGVIYISTQIAKLPWVIKNKDNEIQYDNTIQKLIDKRPNPEMTSWSFKLVMTQLAIHKGNAFAEVERDILGRPKALWPLETESVQLMRDVNGKLWYKVLGGNTINPSEDVYLQPKNVFHLKNFHTNDGLIGQGLVAYASETLGIAMGADKMANSLFHNGGLPSGVLKTDGLLSEEAAVRLKESWNQAHTGRKVGGTAVLEQGVTYEKISHDPEALQFLDSRKFGVTEIARFLRIPLTKLYVQEAATYNNIEHANLEVAVDTLDAWARNWEAEADAKLLNDGHSGLRTEMDLYQVFRGDMKTRSDYFSKMMQTASISPNEIRRKEGMSPYSGGDRYFLAVNNYSPMDRVDELIDAQVSKDKDPAKDKEVNEAVVALLKKRAKQ